MFQELKFYIMKKYLMLLIFLILNSSFLIQNSFSQWVQQNVPVSGGSFNDMKFVNANTGFIINWNYPIATLLRSTNAGYNWQILNNWGMAKVAIVDTTCIYASGYNNGKGVIYKSSNLGVTWDSIMSSNNFYYNNLLFFNRDTGLISSGNGTDNQIWRSTDGGQSLQLITSYGGATSGNFFFLKEKINGEYYGWMYYPGGSQIRVTTNSGVNWTQLPNIPGFNSVRGFCFTNRDTGWVTITNYSNFVYYTANGGLNWTNKFMPYNSVMHYDICFKNLNTGWIGFSSNQKIYKTTDGGNIWGTQNVSGAGSALLYFIDSITGWAQTSSSTISRTTNGGGPITSIISGSTETQKDYRLYQNYPNPFNPSTSIKYYLRTKSYVELKIFDISGKEVFNVMSKEQNAGDYEKLIDLSNKASGIYFYRLMVKDNRLNTVFSGTKRMIYLK